MDTTRRTPRGPPECGADPPVGGATGSQLVFVAGQVAWDAEGRTVGEGDLAAQVEQCYVNIGTALAAVGGTFADLAKLTVYVVDWAPGKMPLFLEGVSRAATRLGGAPVPPGTLVGVAALDIPEHLVEIEAVAVLDA
ncbi:RidA family protein [Streptomyces anulatus]|uniref:RidA family protein n=1 Tax=Streptomyces anulatus TaxID=1892 RepID=UPI0036497B10